MLRTRFKKAISLYLALQITAAPLYATFHEMATDRIHGGNLIASRQGAQQINFGNNRGVDTIALPGNEYFIPDNALGGPARRQVLEEKLQILQNYEGGMV